MAKGPQRPMQAEVAVMKTDVDTVKTDVGNLQTEINNKQNKITGAASSVITNNLTGGKMLMSDGSGKIIASTYGSNDFLNKTAYQIKSHHFSSRSSTWVTLITTPLINISARNPAAAGVSGIYVDPLQSGAVEVHHSFIEEGRLVTGARTYVASGSSFFIDAPDYDGYLKQGQITLVTVGVTYFIDYSYYRENVSECDVRIRMESQS